MNKLPTYELFLEDNEEIALALVKNPAIESDFIYFNEEGIKYEFNDEQMIVKGAALIPNKRIYRNDNIGERNVFMSEDTVRKFAEYLINKQGSKFNLGHTDNIIEVNLIESYFAQEPNEFGVTKGSWIVSLKLKSIDAWEQVKNGEFKGFSIEGIFSNELSKFTTNINKQNKEKMELKEKIMEAVNAVLFNEVKVEEVKEEIKVEEFAAPVVPVNPADATVADDNGSTPEPITAEEVQSMIDAAVMTATETIMKACKDMMDKGTQDTATAMSDMKAKIEEFGSQPLSVPVTEVIENKSELTNKNDKYDSLRGFNK